MNTRVVCGSGLVWVKQEVGLAAQSILMISTESMDIKDLVEITLLSAVRGDLFPSPYLRLYLTEIWGSYGNVRSWRNELPRSLISELEGK